MLRQSRFIRGLFKLLEDKSHSQIIEWNEDGSAFIVKDSKAMPNVLKSYFKDVRPKSFFRKLILYGFVLQKDVYRQKTYHHEYFHRNMGEEENILMMSRNKTSDLDAISRESHQLMRQLSELKQHQLRMSDQIKQTLSIQEEACKCIDKCSKHLIGRCNVCHRRKNKGKNILQPLFQILLSHQETFHCDGHVQELIQALPQPSDIYTPLNKI